MPDCTRLYVGQPCPSVLCSRDASIFRLSLLASGIVFELEVLGMANLCPSTVTLFTMLESLVFFFGIYFRCLFVRLFDSSLIFLSFSFVMNFIFIFIIFLAGRNYK